MKPPAFRSPPHSLSKTFSALGRAVWDETYKCCPYVPPPPSLSVLSVEPYGMKQCLPNAIPGLICTFSALGRAVWDETCVVAHSNPRIFWLSVLSVEPYGMKLINSPAHWRPRLPFSALGRAVWDETDAAFVPTINKIMNLSVLSVEPYGMKPKLKTTLIRPIHIPFSALGRAVWDETSGFPFSSSFSFKNFQCSRSSRMG